MHILMSGSFKIIIISKKQMMKEDFTMKNQNAITLISLVITIIVLFIITSITVISSIENYKQMRFETARVQLEEVQKKVDEICSDYNSYKNELENQNYSEYFKEKYGIEYNYDRDNILFSDTIDSKDIENIEKILEKYSVLKDHIGKVFYFNNNEIIKIFGLIGINSNIIVDFSTRSVYYINGIIDSSDTDIIYFTQIEYEEDSKIEYVEKTEKCIESITLEDINKYKVGNTDMVEIKIRVSSDSNDDDLISKGFYDNSGYGQNVNWIRLKDFDYYKNEDDIYILKFVIYDSNIAQVKVVDKFQDEYILEIGEIID